MDYCGVSIFLQPYVASEYSERSPSAMKYLDAMAEFCNDKQIPVMIAESTPFGGYTSYLLNTYFYAQFPPLLPVANMYYPTTITVRLCNANIFHLFVVFRNHWR